MTEIHTPIPEGCHAVGCIYADADRSILGEDMLDVTLPNGVLVSVGWYPECDPKGQYRIIVSRGLESISTTAGDAWEASRLVQEVIKENS